MISREVVTNGEISWIIEELGNLTFDGRRIPSQYNVAAPCLAKLALSSQHHDSLVFEKKNVQKL